MDPEILDTEQFPTAEAGRGPSRVTRYVAAAALVSAAVTFGALFSPIGLAGAQSDDDASQSVDDATEDGTAVEDDADHRHGLRHRLMGLRESVDEVAAALDLPSDELMTQLRDGATLAEVAEAQGVDIGTITALILDNVEERLDEEVAEGHIDQDKADELYTRAEEHVDELVHQTLPEPGDRGPAGRGPGFRFGGLGDLAEELGLDPAEVMEGLAQGRTPAEIAAEAGVEQDELVDTLVAEATERIDQAVADGRLDEERARELKDGLEDRITELVTSTPGDMAGRFGRHADMAGRFGRHGGMGGGPGHRHGPGDDGAVGYGSGPAADSDQSGSGDDAADTGEGVTEGSSYSF